MYASATRARHISQTRAKTIGPGGRIAEPDTAELLIVRNRERTRIRSVLHFLLLLLLRVVLVWADRRITGTNCIVAVWRGPTSRKDEVFKVWTPCQDKRNI